MTQSEEVGVYVLGNDAILSWIRSFVRSFRRYNARVPLCFIPFDDHTAASEALVTAAGGTVLRNPELFARLDAIGHSLELGLTPYGPHWFRRFAAFHGNFEKFLYLDARVVVLGPLEPIVADVRPGEVDLVHFDRMINEVYRDGVVRQEFVRAGLGRGFNSGMWASRRGLFTIAQMESVAVALRDVRDQMNPRNTDQFFLNYLCDSGRVNAVHFADLHEEYAHACWAGDGGEIYREGDGVWRRWKFGSQEHRRRIPFVHWAGFRLSRSMPHRHLHDRFQGERYRRGNRILSEMLALPGRILQAFRSNRHVNTLYHRLRSRH